MDCFGVLDRVFPMGKEGLREIVPECFNCPDRKACLQDRAPANGLSGKLRRWSEKKQLSRLIKKMEGNKK